MRKVSFILFSCFTLAAVFAAGCGDNQSAGTRRAKISSGRNAKGNRVGGPTGIDTTGSAPTGTPGGTPAQGGAQPGAQAGVQPTRPGTPGASPVANGTVVKIAVVQQQSRENVQAVIADYTKIGTRIHPADIPTGNYELTHVLSAAKTNLSAGDKADWILRQFDVLSRNGRVSLSNPTASRTGNTNTAQPAQKFNLATRVEIVETSPGKKDPNTKEVWTFQTQSGQAGAITISESQGSKENAFTRLASGQAKITKDNILNLKSGDIEFNLIVAQTDEGLAVTEEARTRTSFQTVIALYKRVGATKSGEPVEKKASSPIPRTPPQEEIQSPHQQPAQSEEPAPSASQPTVSPAVGSAPEVGPEPKSVDEIVPLPPQPTQDDLVDGMGY